MLILYQTVPSFHDPRKEGSENNVGKGENAAKQNFLLPKSFYP